MRTSGRLDAVPTCHSAVVLDPNEVAGVFDLPVDCTRNRVVSQELMAKIVFRGCDIDRVKIGHGADDLPSAVASCHVAVLAVPVICHRENSTIEQNESCSDFTTRWCYRITLKIGSSRLPMSSSSPCLYFDAYMRE